MTARDVAIRGTMPRADGALGRGAEASMGAHVVLERVALERNHETALFTLDTGTTVEVRDAVIRDTTPRAGSVGGRGVSAQMGASVVLERVALERNQEHALFAGGADTSLQVRDAVVRDTMPVADGTFGRGAEASAGAHLVLERVVLERNREAAVVALETGTSVELRDTIVRDTSPRADGQAGRGAEAQPGARLVLERVVLERNFQIGLLASGAGTSVDLRDAVIRDTAPEARTGFFGTGLWAHQEAVVEGSRVVVEQSAFAGMTAIAAASIVLTDARVSGVAQSGCNVCTGPAGGFGLTAHLAGTVALSAFAIGDAALCGVVVGPNSDTRGATGLDLSDGVVERAPIGACVLVDDFDASRLRNGVEYRDVGSPLQAPMLVLPDAPPSL